jgi:hypothetical protein
MTRSWRRRRNGSLFSRAEIRDIAGRASTIDVLLWDC